MQKPSIGRIVHFQLPNHMITDVAHLVEPAIITAVHTDEIVDLSVFHRLGGVQGIQDVILQHKPGQPFTWFWPPKV